MSRRDIKPAPTSANPETVLVAVGDVLARMSFAEYLRECGYEIIEAGSAEDVRTVMQSGPMIDVLLLDWQISNWEGFSLTRDVREKHPATNIVLTFGIARAAEKAGEICDDGPLERPYHPQEILRRIQKLHRTHRHALG
jgi:DNA-binding response OmpR family regulator